MAEAKRRNFSREAKELISFLIIKYKKYKDVLENKKTDSNTLGAKEKCWKTVTEEFNCSVSAPRTTLQLKSYYKNAKSDLKKRIAANRASIFRTGGGEQQFVLDESDPLLSIVTPQTFALDNPFDSSHELFNENGQNRRDSMGITESNSSEPAERISRKHQRNKQPSEFEEERQNLFKEIAELKRQKLSSEIEKNKLKSDLYKEKIEMIKEYRNNNNKQ